jgi:antiphage defense system Thoeris ThsA-like protein
VGAILGFLAKSRYQVVALVVSALLILTSVYEMEDITKLRLTPLAHPIYPLFIVGVLLMAASVVTVVLPSWSRSPVAGQITARQDSITTNIGQNSLRVEAGRLETSVSDPDCALIVLPANEYFDDECIGDTKSALGAFVQAKLRGRTAEFQTEVNAQLACLSSEEVVIEGKSKRRYGVGSAIYLDHPLKETLHLLLVAATTQRPGEGLRGDSRALFTIARAAIAKAKDKRLQCIVQPLIGAGHGAIKPTRALLVQLIAWGEILYENPGLKVSITIVILQPNETNRSAVSLKQARKLLEIAVSICQP